MPTWFTMGQIPMTEDKCPECHGVGITMHVIYGTWDPVIMTLYRVLPISTVNVISGPCPVCRPDDAKAYVLPGPELPPGYNPSEWKLRDSNLPRYEGEKCSEPKPIEDGEYPTLTPSLHEMFDMSAHETPASDGWGDPNADPVSDLAAFMKDYDAPTPPVDCPA